MTLELVAGDARLVVDPDAGARAVSWSVAGLELLGHASDEEASTPLGRGMYLMAPWAGRLRDNTLVHGGARHPMPAGPSGWALHGTVLAETWRVLEPTHPDEPAPDRPDEAALRLTVDLGPPWPWAGQVTVTWRLRPDALETTLRVTSAAQAFPASVGWHPWFRRSLDRGGPVQVDLPGSTMLERGRDHLPTGGVVPRPAGPYDDVFPLPDGRAALTWPGALRLECRTDCPYVVFFDEHPGAVCLEPQSAPPDGPNTGPTLVTPGSPLAATATWSWELDAG